MNILRQSAVQNSFQINLLSNS